MTSHWMFNCREISQRVSRSFEQDLPWIHRLMVWFHLKMCRHCARFAHQLSVIRQSVEQAERQDRLPTPHLKLPDDARERIKRALQSV